MTSNPFHSAMTNIKTNNGAISYSSPDISGDYDGRLSWFFKGIRGLNFVYAAAYLKKAMQESKVDTICLVFNTRDVLKGKGERDLGRKAMQWLLINYPEDMKKVIHHIPEYGRWDDLYCLFPRVLNLTDLTWVNSNFCSNISVETLKTAQDVQKWVVRFYKDQLQKDWTDYNASKPIGLAAKWCETEGSGDDRKYGLVQQICTEWNLHPKGYRVRVSEMRTALGVVEKLCAGKRWNEIDYSKVPAQTMKKLRKAFGKNDPERFQEWCQKLQKRDPSVKVNAKTLHPHELVYEYMCSGTGHQWSTQYSSIKQDPVIEAQWKELESIVRASAALEKTIVVSDVSGSMYSQYGNTKTSARPIDVCIALSLLIARTSKAPWNNSVIAFSESPVFQQLNNNPNQSLAEMVDEMCRIPAGFNTDFYKVFDNIIRRHNQFKLAPEEHPERVIVISDMQFDVADRNATNLEAIDRLYAQNKLKRPTLIFWNVNSGLDFPATTRDQNLCLIGGFSPSIMTALSTTKEFSPACVLREVIDSVRYDPIRNSIKE